MLEHDILTPQEIAKILLCDEKTVEEAARKGTLPGVKFGRGWVFPKAALLEALNSQAKEEAESRKYRTTSPLAITGKQPKQAKRNPPALPELPLT